METHETEHPEKEPKINLPAAKKVKKGVSIAKTSLILGLSLVLIAGMALGYFIKPAAPSEDHLAMIENKDVAEQRGDWVALADNIRGELAKEGEYNCCIEEPCTYCLYDEGECQCRQDILDGEHPCGECIGEILEGKGLVELKPYFAKAIAHKVGSQHEGHLQEIIDDMYQ
ncbi:MAG: hypothetical protein ACC618_00800 [Patescibacteria group bacterium]